MLFPRMYSTLEEAFALLLAAMLLSLGVTFFEASSAISGGLTGLTMLLVDYVPVSFGTLLVILNLPFYLLAYFRIGKVVAFKSVFCSSLVSLCVDHMWSVLDIAYIHPLYAAVAGGMLFGCGLLILLRHNGSLGGFTILAMYMERRWSIHIGRTQLIIDILIISLSYIHASLMGLILSCLAVSLLNLVIILNHKPRGYRGIG